MLTDRGERAEACYASIAATLPGLSGFPEEEAGPLATLASDLDWLEAHPLAWQSFTFSTASPGDWRGPTSWAPMNCC